MADITINRGDTVKLNGAATAAGVAYPLTGAKIWFTAKYLVGDPDGSAVFQKTTTNGGISITDAVNGKFQITIAPADTVGLPNSKTLLLWDCQVKSSLGDVYTVASGNLIVIPDITNSTT